jgi:hypothetical protein
MDATTVVPDVYKMLETRNSTEDIEFIAQTFADECYEFMLNSLQPEEERSGLRLSAIGKPARQLWHVVNDTKKPGIDGPTYIKFLYGHLV